MEVLKLLLVTLILTIFTLASAEEAKREGRCHSKPMKSNLKSRVRQRKPIAMHRHSGHKFNFRKKDDSLSGTSMSTASADAHANSDASSFNNQYHILPEQETYLDKPSKIIQRPDPVPEREVELGEDFAETGFAPRLSISEFGDITFARSINFEKEFHDYDSIEYNHDHDHHLDEDHDHFHKIRTARKMNLRRSGNKDSSNPEQLSSTLGSMNQQGSQTLNNVGVGNAASTGDIFELQASGQSISASNNGNSGVTGSGTISATGFTSSSTNGESSGWHSRKRRSNKGSSSHEQLSSALERMNHQDTQTLNNVGVGNAASAGDTFDLQASGQSISASHSGNSGVTGSGTISATGFTSVSTNGAGSGWKSR